MAKKALSGLDMAETLLFYEEHQDRLLGMIPASAPRDERLPFPLRHTKFLQLDRHTLLALWFLFPEEARNRSVLRRVEGRPAAWFHAGSMGEAGPFKTENPAEALSPTAIIPSYCDYNRWLADRPTCDIRLHYIHPLTCPPAVRHIILAEGFVHEVAHSIIAPALYSNWYRMQLPTKGKIAPNCCNWLKFVLGRAAERKSAISHYASTYRDEDGRFKHDKINNTSTAVSEEIAECVTAFLLGFVFCREHRRRFNPFCDRPEVKQLVRNFLYAHHIPGAASKTGLA